MYSLSAVTYLPSRCSVLAYMVSAFTLPLQTSMRTPGCRSLRALRAEDVTSSGRPFVLSAKKVLYAAIACLLYAPLRDLKVFIVLLYAYEVPTAYLLGGHAGAPAPHAVVQDCVAFVGVCPD